MELNQSLNHFLSQTDSVGAGLFGLLLTMSVASWYFIVVKAWRAVRVRRQADDFLRRFWNADTLSEVASQVRGRDPFSNLTRHALAASQHHARHGHGLQQAGSASDFLTRAMRRAIDEETAQLEWGLTALASIASTAPFVGLFGTVWGVYHALVGIGQGGLATLDQIAGPVGEALIMTGLGLAVAIPAVLAYNDCVRGNRLLLSRLDGFAHDLFAFLTTGSALNPGQIPTQPIGAELAYVGGEH
ncbi:MULTISPECIES: MotA/TolQ/ExbB proton channel family protein [Methylomonas]|uniref:Biopolymer transport protein ExbB n=1 Tax=Methylomonas koyamae TaxID=702114 RepID=A0A177NFS4_9GAMM|nr:MULTISPECIES: MotA/TolQ/ExbB proton channel family protein [Methylomonas]NJA05243.1 MotA/TolQ/ExbB proton channel family protein [Methylococcaceae bacterium WWC4]OAI16692.1 biopolymer transporter ExbB [Methylomonas koyamae]OHX36249.1 biopolymer transporter ExbB [Methylomonas sp. LWB]WGS84292.1 MotA/TolQ/ExbB proton channel family protein [Methylomonas sp. UP202]